MFLVIEDVLKETTAEPRRICFCEFSGRNPEEEGHGVLGFGRFFYCSLPSFHVVLPLELKFLKAHTSPFQKLKIIQKECTNSQYTY